MDSGKVPTFVTGSVHHFHRQNFYVQPGPTEVQFGNHRITSLLLVMHVDLLASSSQDLQCALAWFAAECEAAGMRAALLNPRLKSLTGKRLLALYGSVERHCLNWRGSSIMGSCSHVRGIWSAGSIGAVLVCRGEEGAKPKGKAPIDLRSHPQ